MHCNSLILINGKTILKGPFLKPVDSILQFPLDSIDSGKLNQHNLDRVKQLILTCFVPQRPGLQEIERL